MSPKLILKTRNGIIQAGHGIISPIAWPLIEKLVLQNVYKFYQRVETSYKTGPRYFSRTWRQNNVISLGQTKHDKI